VPSVPVNAGSGLPSLMHDSKIRFASLSGTLDQTTLAERFAPSGGSVETAGRDILSGDSWRETSWTDNLDPSRN